MTFAANTDSLPAPQRRLWVELTPLRHRFVLYGGTAVALRCGHRTSVDFDFFTEERIDIDGMLASHAFLAGAEVLQRESDTLTVSIDRGGPVKVSFFGNITFGRIGTPEETNDGVIAVASSLDLLATKLKVLLQRIEVKDYLDIEALIRSGVPLGRGLGGARTLYGNAFVPMECVKALTYFQEGSARDVPDSTRRFLEAAVDAWDMSVADVPIVSRSLGLG